MGTPRIRPSCELSRTSLGAPKVQQTQRLHRPYRRHPPISAQGSSKTSAKLLQLGNDTKIDALHRRPIRSSSNSCRNLELIGSSLRTLISKDQLMSYR